MNLTVKEYSYEKKVGRYIGYYFGDKCIHGQFISVKTDWEDGDHLFNLLSSELKRITNSDIGFYRHGFENVLQYFIDTIRIKNEETEAKEIILVL